MNWELKEEETYQYLQNIVLNEIQSLRRKYTIYYHLDI